MPNLIKILRNVLFFFIFATLMIHVFSFTSVDISDKVNLTNDQLSNVLTSLDIFLSTLLALYSLVDQKLAEKKCVYDFTIEENSLSLHKYKRYPSEIENAFAYVCDTGNDSIDTPYYGIEICLEDNPLCSVGIPLCMKVSTKLDGKSIELSHLRVYVTRQGKIEKKAKLLKGVEIEKPIQDEKEFLIRVLLLCNNQLEKILLDSRIYLSFVLTLMDDRGHRYNKFLFLKVQNVMGESTILSISSQNSRLSYIRKLVKLHFKLNKKN